MIDVKGINTWIELSESAYANNLRRFRQMIGSERELSVVVKANAYGHGWAPIARMAVQHGADSFCVHSLPEAQQLRQAGFDQDILIMGHVPLARLAEVVAGNFRLVIYNPETVRQLAELLEGQSGALRMHLKLETGANRQGIDEADLPWFLSQIAAIPGLHLEGAYTHFADIEDTTDHHFAEQQKQRFQRMVKSIRQAGFTLPKLHTACTAATLLFPETHFDLVRLGIGQYGFWPSRETLVSYKIQHNNDIEGLLQPVLTWKTRVSQVKQVAPESSIGYGRTYRTTRASRIAVLPVGYSDGYDRGLSNQGYVLIRGKRAPVRGRICMNLMMVDVTDIPGVKLEDEVVLIGRQGQDAVAADQLASLCGTIHYEIVARLSREIPRIAVP